MTIDVQISESLQRSMGALEPAGRRQLFSAAGNAVSKLINDHLKRIAPTRHGTAERLGATPTGHLERRTTFASDESSATVTIPIPGISRAFRSLVITPRKARSLTIPLNAISYGKRAGEVRRIGWTLFRPAAKGSHKNAQGGFSEYQDLLMGSKDGETMPLYLLRKRATQGQDRTLLPSDAAISRTAADAMLAVIRKGHA